MAMTKTDIVASAIIVPSLVVLLILDVITPGFYYDLSDSTRKLFTTTTVVAALVGFAICCLHVRRVSTLRCKILIVGVFLSSVVAVLSLHFLPSPPRWDFEFRMIFSIDTVGMVVFLLVIFVHDKKITIVLALLVSSLALLYVNRGYLYEKFNPLITCNLAIVIYLVLSLLYVTHFSNKWWKVTVVIIFASVIIVLVRLYGIFEWQIHFFYITSIDACSALLLGLWMFARKARHEEMLQDEQYNLLEMAGLPTRFTIKDLETATSNFQTPIGEGGSGAVFKGTFDDGSIVAVKRIKGQASGEVEFRTEITIIASLQHISLVRLLGYCLSRGGDRYLIYPFFENGSLDAWLFKDKEKRENLTWIYRYRIASDVAKALAYLHHECHHRVLHLDIKPANILLDSSFRALVSDFGISKSIGKDQSSVMTRARGTIGYLAPEMLVPNAISTKSDVYSYGMVLLELVGGRRNFITVVDTESQQTHCSYFPKIVKEKMLQGKLMEVVDPCLKREEIREEEVTILLRVAFWCIQESPELRPSTIEIADMLDGRIPVPVPPESPMFVVNFFNDETQSSTSYQARDMDVAGNSNNQLSISIQSGR
ncbi:Receptor protein kinase [Rhynchospora pubera]|uniref:Receptor protein kinase n=1 Tax=Rhynchospora pubera TaxID=906938 RepID=A0AAV8CJ55_9POAL|nr:Receptor protein kinase [Rhynchospora pubera]